MFVSRALLPAMLAMLAVFAAFAVLPRMAAFGQVRLPSLDRSELPLALTGQILIEELNCVACHDSKPLSDVSRRAPRLSGVGGRIHPAYLRAFLKDPHRIAPGTLMPDVLGELEAKERESVAESLTHYLVSLNKGESFTPRAPDAVAAEQGEQLFHSVGCVACHSPRDPGGRELLEETSVPLGELEKKYSFRSLVGFLRHPLAIRPSGRMPDPGLSGPETERIAHYLLRHTQVPGHLQYTTWRGRVWEGLRGDVKKEKAGQVDDFSLERLGTLPHQTAIRFAGFLRAEAAGEYTFHLEFNGGSLRVDDDERIAVAPSNRRGPVKAEGTATLKSGWNRIELTYFHTGEEPRLRLEMEGPGFDRRPIPASMLTTFVPAVAPFRPLEPDLALATAGKQYFQRYLCAQCHDDVEAPSHDVPSWKHLDPAKGCLAEAPGTPRFPVDEAQREAIRAALPAVDKSELTASQTIDKTLVAFHCLACHERQGLGGIDPDRDPYFTGTKEALGNQGRIPPPLTHVGAKLTPSALREVLREGGRHRDYLNTRMPRFGESNVGHLAELFDQVDSLEDAVIPRVENIRESKEAGYEMMGAGGFSCIACHDFNGQKSGGAGALDLVDVADRVKKNWFHLYLREPFRFHPTVIMPSYWPGGQSTRKQWLDGDADGQIEALWNYLSDGGRARNPRGLSRQSLRLRVADETVMCRGRGTAGYRGIGVGYPERISLAFDTEEMALRLLWKGEFADIDHGRFRARGRDRVEFPPGIPFHRLPSLDHPWPYKGKTDHGFPRNHGYRYRGYHLGDERRPTFCYRYGEVEVEDFFRDRLDAGGRAFFRRILTFSSPAEQEAFFFRVASGNAITGAGQTWKIDRLQLRLPADLQTVVREGEPMELLVPMRLPAGKTTLELEYQW